MIINLLKIHEGHTALHQDVDLAEVYAAEATFVGPVRCRVEIDSVRQQMFVHVWFEADLKLECARCLEEYEISVKNDYRLIMQEAGPDTPVGTSEDDVVDYYFSTEEPDVDIRQVLYDEIMTNLPLMPLCKPECEGINVGSGKEQPSRKMTDPRWDALKKLKQSGGNPSEHN